MRYDKRLTHKGIWYWPNFEAAQAYAREVDLPTDRIVRYRRGWAIQLRSSGPYAGPKDTPWLE